MLNGFAGGDKAYIACGYTDLRKGIDGLTRMVQQQFELEPFSQRTVSVVNIRLPVGSFQPAAFIFIGFNFSASA